MFEQKVTKNENVNERKVGDVSKCQFHQHFTHSFYTSRFKKRKKTDSLTVFFCAFGIPRMSKLLVKCWWNRPQIDILPSKLSYIIFSPTKMSSYCHVLTSTNCLIYNILFFMLLQSISQIWTRFICLWWFSFRLECFPHCPNCLKKAAYFKNDKKKLINNYLSVLV